jgi:hypothetical protein
LSAVLVVFALLSAATSKGTTAFTRDYWGGSVLGILLASLLLLFVVRPLARKLLERRIVSASDRLLMNWLAVLAFMVDTETRLYREKSHLGQPRPVTST